ncbi:PKD domain-containing protein [Solirubrobacter phytolaccae]|uniref:PKD domain-containing protein n=1 Tax=Solirubrobacter phytolaccae TaxID=1404360 RepID=A0A9X3S954_9ACTN|nr:PKD domain-containing protein [Solirubrobacter phytolaccae]MDA0183019.1 PKD domain-containing protein [Solirubrobacter phytolaccae]
MSKRWLTLVATVLAAVLLAPGAAMAAPSWLTPQTFEGSARYSETKTAMAADGTIVTAATRIGDGGSIQLVASVRRPGRAFGPAQVLDTVAPGAALFLGRVNASPDGQFAIPYLKAGAGGILVSFLRADGTFSPPNFTPDNLYWATSKMIGYDAASTLYVARPYPSNDTLGTVEVQRADGSRATQFFPMTGFDTSESETAIAVAPDGSFTVLYTTQAKAAGAECGTQRLFAINGTAAGVGTPQLLAERAPITYAPGSDPSCLPVKIAGVSVLRLADGTLTAVYDEQVPNPAGSSLDAAQQITLVSRAPGATTWSAPQTFPHPSSPIRLATTKLTLAGTTPVLTYFDQALGANFVSVRRPDGSWRTPQRVGTGAEPELPASVIGLPDGTSEIVYADAAALAAYTRSVAADGTLSAAPRLLLANYTNLALVNEGMEVATDGKGNGVLSGVSTSADAATLTHVPFDGAAPVLTDLAVPAVGQPGTPLSFATTAFDVWGPVKLAWTYGDGASGAGGEHTYANAGQFTATVTATDEAGNASTKSGPVAITLPPQRTGPIQPPLPADTTAPRFTTKPRVTPTKPTAKKAATLTFGLSEAANVTAVVQLKTKGIKRTAKGKCGKAPKTKPKGAKPCTLLVTKTTRKGAFKVGAGTIKLPKTLKAGSYTIAITATDTAGNTAKATATFTVRAAKKRGA